MKEPEDGERRSRSLKHWLSGAFGIALVLAYGWAAAQSDPRDPAGVYLLRIGFLAGALGAAVVGTLDRLEGTNVRDGR